MALLFPVPSVGDIPQFPLGHRLGAVDGFELEDLGLEVGREEQESEQLGLPGAREPELARDGRAVGDGVPVDGALHVVREYELVGHHACSSLSHQRTVPQEGT